MILQLSELYQVCYLKNLVLNYKTKMVTDYGPHRKIKPDCQTVLKVRLKYGVKCAEEDKSNYWFVTYIVTARLYQGFLNGFCYHVHLQRLVRLHIHVYFHVICGSYEL